METAKKVPTWRLTPTEGEHGPKWKLVRGQNYVSKTGGDNLRGDLQNAMPSITDLIRSCKTSSKDNRSNVSIQGTTSPEMTSNCNDNLHRNNDSEFPVIVKDISHGQFSSSMQNSNVCDPQTSLQSLRTPGKSTARGMISNKNGRKRPPFKSTFRKVEPSSSHPSKSDALQTVQLCAKSSREMCKEGDGEYAFMFKTGTGKSVGISSSSLKRARVVLGEDHKSDSNPERAGPEQDSDSNADSVRCAKGLGECAVLFKTATGKSVGVSASSLKKARAVLGEDLTLNLSDPGRAGSQQDSESVWMFQTAAGNPLAVSVSSIKKAQAILHDDCTRVALKSHGEMVNHTTNEMATIFQANEGDPVTVPLASINRIKSVLYEDPPMELLEHGKSVPQIVDKSITMVDTSTECHVTIPSSASITLLNSENALRVPVSVAPLSLNREKNVAEEDSYSRVPELDMKPKSHILDKDIAMCQAAVGNPVTVLPSSVNKAPAFFGENSTSPLIESDIRSVPQITNKATTILRITAGNPASAFSSATKKAKTMLSKQPSSELVGHGNTKQMVNTYPTKFHAVAGSCLNISPADIKQSMTEVNKEEDLQIMQDSRYQHEMPNSEGGLRSSNVKKQTATLFQTATGKSVSVSTASLKRALSIFSNDGNLHVDGDNPTTSIFQVAVKKAEESPLPCNEKEETILGEGSKEIGDLFERKTEDGEDKAKFQLHNANQCKLNEYDDAAIELVEKPSISIHESGEITEESKYAAPRTHFCQSLFQTGSGKPVNISMSSISKAKSLLESEGLEACAANKSFEAYKGSAPDAIDSTVDQSNDLLDRVSAITANGHNICSVGLADSAVNKMHQFAFQTATGIPLNVSTEAMKRAMNLLGDEANKHTVGMKSLDDLKVNTVISCATTPLLFQTGTGKTVCISNSAMRRARNLLGEITAISSATTDSQSLSEDFIDSPVGASVRHCKTFSKKETFSYASHVSEVISLGMNRAPTDVRLSTDFGNCATVLSPRTPRHLQDNVSNKENLPFLNHVSGVVPLAINSSSKKLPCVGTVASHVDSMIVSGDSCVKQLGKRKVCISPLAEISNQNPHSNLDNHFQQPTPTSAVHKSVLGSKQGLRRSRYVSPFKQPRRSMFSSPYDKRPCSSVKESSLPVQCFPQEDTCQEKFEFRYPSHQKRKTIQQHFGGPPDHQQALWHLSIEIQAMTADAAQHYKFRAKSDSGYKNLTPGDFFKRLLQSGTDPRHATIEWVENHYKWIVWKLACIERSYARQAGGKYLTVQNVIDELKYRYEREVNRGHRSPLKKIVEGDAAASCMMVLCVSAVRVWPAEEQNDPSLKRSTGVSMESENCIGNDIAKYASGNQARIELTDGWYCLNAILDKDLSKQLLHGKLFIGQKLRICGASLHGWVGPLSPLEAFRTVSLVLHINGTYRAHWAERLSFCRGLPVPLAFKCIKECGGSVPRTLVGVTRIYPILYMERLASGVHVTRSERAEDKKLHLYNERRTNIAEDIMLEADKGTFHSLVDWNKDEGARLYSILENAAEPELIMADMTSSQLAAFAAYQSKQEAFRHASIEKEIQKALEDADLDSRKVAPFLRIRVVGVTRKCMSNWKEERHMEGASKQEGLVTIWQPTEKQVLDLEEGAIYCVSGLVPLVGKSSDRYGHNIIQFQANRSTLWHRIPRQMCNNFEFVYAPRSAVSLSDLGKVPLRSEFDVAVLVLHVGEPYMYALRKRQWLFASDNSVEIEGSNIESEIILAIDFSLPCDSFIALDHSLVGSTVGICNLVKQKRDQNNRLWVAEMTQHSIHSVNFNAPNFCHLKSAAESVDKWAKVSLHALEKLSQRVYDIVRNAM